jgi:hypothetical protein
MIDSPTATQCDVEMQVTPKSGSGEVMVVACFQALAVGPVKSRTPAAGEVVMVLPTVTHV